MANKCSLFKFKNIFIYAYITWIYVFPCIWECLGLKNSKKNCVLKDHRFSLLIKQTTNKSQNKTKHPPCSIWTTQRFFFWSFNKKPSKNFPYETLLRAKERNLMNWTVYKREGIVKNVMRLGVIPKQKLCSPRIFLIV